MSLKWKYRISGMAAGIINGLFGGGGGMIMVPLLLQWCRLEEQKAFASCTAVILPLCLVSAGVSFFRSGWDLLPALPYLLGGVVGGFLGGKWFTRIDPLWLKRIFAAFLIYGGLRYLL